jgi:hypothetical protein
MLFASCFQRLTELGMLESGWKHFNRQLPMSGQVFAQSGQGWWHGMSSELSAIVVIWDLADANTMPAGIAASATLMASRPRATKQRWSKFFTTLACHTRRLATRLLGTFHADVEANMNHYND